MWRWDRNSDTSAMYRMRRLKTVFLPVRVRYRVRRIMGGLSLKCHIEIVRTTVFMDQWYCISFSKGTFFWSPYLFYIKHYRTLLLPNRFCSSSEISPFHFFSVVSSVVVWLLYIATSKHFDTLFCSTLHFFSTRFSCFNFTFGKNSEGLFLNHVFLWSLLKREEL